MTVSETNARRGWQRLALPILGAGMGAVALPNTSSRWLYVFFGILAMAAGVQLGVPSTNGRRFGLPVAVGVATPIFLADGNQVDLPAIFLVYGAGIAIGSLISSIRPTSKADSSGIRSLLGMSLYAIAFTWCWDQRRCCRSIAAGGSSFLSFWPRRFGYWSTP